MFRKFSTNFKRKKEEINGVNVVNGVNGVNGTNGTNGTDHGVTNGTNGQSKAKPALKERHGSFAPFKSKKETSNQSTDHNASRADVENSFELFAQLLHASVRSHIYFFSTSTATESQVTSQKRQIFFGCRLQ